jgi:ATP-dependent DNA helicase RecG
MKMNVFNTIEELLNAKEGEQYQFKEAKTRFDSNEAARCCCALANCGGGKLVFGITDKRPRQVVGSRAFEQPERTRKGLIDKLHVMVDFQLYDHEGKRVLVFNVASRPIGLAVQVDGVTWWYEGDSLIPMPEEIRHKIYEETGFDFSGSICERAKLSDLDPSAIEAFKAKWIARIKTDPDKTGLVNRLDSIDGEQLLRDIGAIVEDGITFAALVLFGTAAALRMHLAQAEVIFEYRPSNRPGPAAAREEFRVGFFAFFDKLWELVNLRNDKLHYQDGFFVFDIPAYNERVVREAILNAVSHRNYQLSGSVFVRQYRDRLEIESPGGFPHGITRENIVFRQAPRNRLIAEILSRCGLVERAGQGMDLIYELCIREAKSLPDFLDSDDYLVRLKLDGNKIDENLLAFFRNIGESVTSSLSTEELLIISSLYHGRELATGLVQHLPRLLKLEIIEYDAQSGYSIYHGKKNPNGSLSGSLNENGSLNDAEKIILVLLRSDPKLTRKELADQTGRPERTIQRAMKSLQDKKIIEREGSKKAGYWRVLRRS